MVIDGGADEDFSGLLDFLKEKSNANVDAWIFTYMHRDHIGAFLQIYDRGDSDGAYNTKRRHCKIRNIKTKQRRNIFFCVAAKTFAVEL